MNFETGLHLHLGYQLPSNDYQLRTLLHNLRFLSPYFSLLVAPSRVINFDGYEYDLEESNIYCKSIKHYISEEQIEEIEDQDDLEYLLEEFENEEDDDARYLAFNFSNLLSLD